MTYGLRSSISFRPVMVIFQFGFILDIALPNRRNSLPVLYRAGSRSKSLLTAKRGNQIIINTATPIQIRIDFTESMSGTEYLGYKAFDDAPIAFRRLKGSFISLDSLLDYFRLETVFIILIDRTVCGLS